MSKGTNFGVPGNPVVDGFPKGSVSPELAQHLGRMAQTAELRLTNLIALMESDYISAETRSELKAEIFARLGLK